MEERIAGYEIVIAGRNVKWPRNEIKYEEIKEEWDKLSPDRTIVGDPAIRYSRVNGEKGIILPGETVKVEDGFSVQVDPSHLS
jgi:hypothetical protein